MRPDFPTARRIVYNKLMMKITERALNQALEHCRRMLPEEACGVFAGERPKCCTRFIRLRNRSAEPLHRFDADPEEWVKTLFELRSRQLDLLGIVHSHPRTPAIPSSLDLQTCWYALPSYWIISFARANAPEVKMFRLLGSKGKAEEADFELVREAL